MTPDRRSPRKVADRFLSFQMEPNNHAIVTNISDEGLGFYAYSPVTESGTIRFSFLENGRRIEASGELVWTDSTKKTGGLRFASLPPADRERIWNWMGHASASTGTASEPAPAQSKESLPLGVGPPQANVALTPYVPPPGVLFPKPTAPGFALLGDDSPYAAHARDQEMPFPGSSTKFFRGFATGVIVSAVLVAILFFADGNRVGGWLTIARAWIGASPAPQSAPAAPPPAGVDPSGLPSGDSIEAPAASAPLPKSAVGDSTPSGAAAQTATEPPVVDDHVTRAPESVPPDGGDADLGLAQSYLSGKTRPPNSAAAARLLWTAVEKGNVTAEIALADLYARGDGVTKSCEQARVLLRAAGKSSREASPELSQIIRAGCP
jgi:hypothetical protein